MPSGFASLDTGFPNLKGMDSSDQQIKAVEDYLVQLLENLRYMLRNIGPENMNTTEVVGWLGEVIEEPIKIAIANVENTLIGRIEIDEASLQTLYQKTDVDELGVGETLYSKITQNAEAISTEVAKTGTGSLGQSETLYSRINQTADDIRTEVSQVTEITANPWAASTSYAVGAYVTVTTGSTTAYYRCNQAHTSSNAKKPGTTGGADYWTPIPAQNGMVKQMSTIDQKADEIKAQVTDSGGNYTVMNLKSDALYIGNGSTAVKISGGNLTDGSVGETQIGANAVTTGKIAANAITSTQIAADAIVTGKIAANAVTAAKIKAGEVGTDQLAANAVTAAKIKAGEVGTDQLAANAVTAAKIKAGAVETDQLAANAVTAAKIKAGEVGTDQLAANAVTAAKIKANTITANEISSNYVYAGNINANQIQSGTAQVGFLTADYVKANALDGFDIYGARYHDSDGDSTLNLESTNSNQRMWFGPANSAWNTGAFAIDHAAGATDYYLCGMRSLTADYSDSAISAYQEWIFSGGFTSSYTTTFNGGMNVNAGIYLGSHMYGTTLPSSDLTEGRLFFLI